MEDTSNTGTAQRSACFCMGAGPEITRLIKTLGPESAMTHFRNARIEFLKGIRELIDQRIQAMSHEEQKGTRVVVE